MDGILLAEIDTNILISQVWRSRSAVSGALEKDKVILARWDPRKPVIIGNIICLTRKEADQHAGLDPNSYRAFYGDEVVNLVEAKLKQQLDIDRWR
jgi:hypothetical protein